MGLLVGLQDNVIREGFDARVDDRDSEVGLLLLQLLPSLDDQCEILGISQSLPIFS